MSAGEAGFLLEEVIEFLLLFVLAGLIAGAVEKSQRMLIAGKNKSITKL